MCTDGLLLCLNDVLLILGNASQMGLYLSPQGRVKITNRFSIALLSAAFLAVPCMAQVSPTFRFQQSNSTATPEHIFAVDLLNAAVGLRDGSHHFEVFAVNTAGTVWKSGVTATVK